MTRLTACLYAGLLATVVALLAPASASAAAGGMQQTVWLQTMDSCRQALPGASQTVHHPGGRFALGPGPGVKPVGVGMALCPAPTGSCTITSTGCVSFSVPIPASGSATYTITQSILQAAPNTVPCNGGSACRSQWAHVVVSSSGSVQSRTTNVYPDGFKSFYPSATGFASGTQSDPILFHDYVLGNGSCDGDNDADDHLTGSPSSHCDSDGDRHRP